MRIVLLVLLVSARIAAAQSALTITEVKLDPATLHTIGVQVLISGDVNYNARISARIGGREVATLFRVRPETVTGVTLPQQFAGTVFDVSPGTSHPIELIATDPDGGGETRMITGVTRALPADPAAPRAVAVTNATQLQAALAGAQPGDIITLADGTYGGAFSLNASGTAANPIVIRGASQAGTIVDGNNCASCNIVEVYGSYVHFERMTIKNGFRALRFLNATTANVVSRVKIENVVHGVSSAPGQSAFTICDNIVHGRLRWPLVYSDDGAIHADDQGIRVDGPGHVVCHNDITGFGDPMINFASARAYDFYGNYIHEIYADGTELDRGEGNVRLFGNRFTNVYTAISIQPAVGGPVYVLRNEVTNVADEHIKLKMTGSEPSGALIYHNTFASPDIALNLQTPITQHDSVIVNNLFVAPASITGRVVDWTARLERVVFDGNAYFPDTGYWFGTVGTARTFATLAAAQAAGVEPSGRVLTGAIFASGFAPPATYTTAIAPPDLALAETSNAIDTAIDLPGINSRRVGTAADIGARERGCPTPVYGPRPDGVSTTNIVDCSADDPQQPGGDAGTDTMPPIESPTGCCQSSQRLPFGSLLLVLVLALYSMKPRLSVASRLGLGSPGQGKRRASDDTRVVTSLVVNHTIDDVSSVAGGDTTVPGIALVASGPKPMSIILDVPAELGRRIVAGKQTYDIDDERMSRDHATVRFDRGWWVIADRDSRNGTWVEGERITGEARRRGDIVLRLGHTVFILLTDVRGHPARDGEHVIGPELEKAFELIRRSSTSDTLLIHGESGSGKELAARLYHDAGPRNQGPFVAVNCAAIPEGVAERLLFGAKKGAFSGAVDARGHFQMASGGTLFLDEIADLDPAVQAKLLRVLETREVTPVGATTGVTIEAGVVAASHRELRTEVAERRFRDDLYYRLARVTVFLPSLRERKVDLARLVQREIAAVDPKLGAHARLLEACCVRPWPGNVRELRAAIRQAASSATAAGRDTIRVEDLSADAGLPVSSAVSTSVKPAPAEVSKDALVAALAKSNGVVSVAARALGLHRTQLYRLMAQHGLAPRDDT